MQRYCKTQVVFDVHNIWWEIVFSLYWNISLVFCCWFSYLFFHISENQFKNFFYLYGIMFIGFVSLCGCISTIFSTWSPAVTGSSTVLTPAPSAALHAIKWHQPMKYRLPFLTNQSQHSHLWWMQEMVGGAVWHKHPLLSHDLEPLNTKSNP